MREDVFPVTELNPMEGEMDTLDEGMGTVRDNLSGLQDIREVSCSTEETPPHERNYVLKAIETRLEYTKSRQKKFAFAGLFFFCLTIYKM